MKSAGFTPGRYAGSADHLGAFEDDVLDWNVLVHAGAAGLHRLDPVDHVLAVDDVTEDAVAPSLRIRRRVVEEAVVVYVDEELRGRGVRLGRACHRDGVAGVLEAVLRLVLDRRLRRLLFHSRLEAATLDHEAIDDTVEKRVRVVPAFHVAEKVLDRLGCARLVELKSDEAEVRMQFDHWETLYFAGRTVADSMTIGSRGTF